MCRFYNNRPRRNEGFMNLFQIHSDIRCQAEGDSDAAWNLCRQKGFGSSITHMVARSVNWRADQEGFRATARCVATDTHIGAFWRGLASEHLGSTAADPAIRIVHFEQALSTVATLPLTSLDRKYVENCANAGLHDTQGANVRDSMDNIVAWMTEHGVYNAPGCARALMLNLFEAGNRDEALSVYSRVIVRAEQPEAYFSPRQMTQLRQIAKDNFRAE